VRDALAPKINLINNNIAPKALFNFIKNRLEKPAYQRKANN
jgi:hypothetical protein